MQTDILKLITSIGASAAMIHQVANGDASFNQGKFAVDDQELTAMLSALIVQQVDELIECTEAASCLNNCICPDIPSTACS